MLLILKLLILPGPPPTKRKRATQDEGDRIEDSNASSHRLHLSDSVKRRLRRKRAELAQYPPNFSPVHKFSANVSLRLAEPRIIKVDILAEDLPFSKGAYVGLCRGTGSKLETLEEWIAKGFAVVKWDGT